MLVVVVLVVMMFVMMVFVIMVFVMVSTAKQCNSTNSSGTSHLAASCVGRGSFSGRRHGWHAGGGAKRRRGDGSSPVLAVMVLVVMAFAPMVLVMVLVMVSPGIAFFRLHLSHRLHHRLIRLRSQAHHPLLLPLFLFPQRFKLLLHDTHVVSCICSCGHRVLTSRWHRMVPAAASRVGRSPLSGRRRVAKRRRGDNRRGHG